MNTRRFQIVVVFVGMIVLNVFFTTWLMSGNAFGVAWASPLKQGLNIPSAFSYQGVLRDANGNLINGAVNLKLKLYGDVTGGTALYSEDFANVNVRDGIFTVVVGDAQVLPISVFDTFPLYLGLSVNNDAEMLPRQRFHPVPYAMQATSAQNAVTADNLAQGGGVPGSVSFGAGGAKAINFPDGGKITDSASGMTLSGGGANKTVTVDGGWNANAIRDIGDSNGGPNQRSTYPVSVNRYIVEAPDQGSSPDTVPIDPQILNDYCRDEDGCWVSLSMRNHDGHDTPLSTDMKRFGLGPVVNGKQFFQTNDLFGTDNDGAVTTLLSVNGGCFFTDGEYVNSLSGTDNKPGFGVLNGAGSWTSPDMVCVLIIED
jgi:hypothetical protein